MLNLSKTSVVILLCMGLSLLSTLPFFLPGTFHDSQRILSIFFNTFFVFLIFYNRPTLLKIQLNFIAIMLIVGLISSLLSEIPIWSLIEVLIFLNIIILTFTFFKRIEFHDLYKISLIFLIIQSIYIIRIFLNYTFTILDKTTLDNTIIIDGFSNIRFYSQFLSWTIPFITAYISLKSDKNSRYFNLIIILLSLSWSLAFFTGTRSFFLGILFSLMAVLFTTRKLWISYLKSTLFFLTTGFSIYICMTFLIPELAGIDNSLLVNSTSNRDFATSSGRIEIWASALSISLIHPYFGIGPMMTATGNNLPGVAHPHNFFIQLAAEWGWPFAIIVVVAGIYSVWIWNKAIKEDPKNRAPLALPITASLSSAFCVSLLDGVMVMPVSLIYFCIIAGIAVALLRSWVPQISTTKTSVLTSAAFLTLTVLLLFITSCQWVHLAQVIHNPNPSPRFWSTGKLQPKESLTLLDLIFIR